MRTECIIGIAERRRKDREKRMLEQILDWARSERDHFESKQGKIGCN
jgi:hypothetical protein